MTCLDVGVVHWFMEEKHHQGTHECTNEINFSEMLIDPVLLPAEVTDS